MTCYVTDLADDTATHVLADKLAAEHPDTSLLINNAGVALGGTFEQVSEEEFDWLLAINLRAVITMTRAMLPVLRANPGSHLVNISSLFGLIARPARSPTPPASSPSAGSPRRCGPNWKATSA